MNHRKATTIVLGICAPLLIGSLAAARGTASGAVPEVAGLVKPGAGVNGASVKPPAKKLTLVGLDNGVTFTAQQNPIELRVTKSVPWSKAPTSTGDQPELTFTAAEGRAMTFELSFDTFESKTDVYTTYIAPLESMAMVMDPNGSEAKKRPTRVKVQGIGAMKFEGVVKSVDCRYTSSLSDGTPVKATCTVTLSEASRASFKKSTSGAAKPS